MCKKPPYSAPLTHSDIQPNRARIIVLEIIEIQSASRTDLHSNALPTRARVARNHILVSRRDTRWSSVVFVDAWNSVVASLLSCWAAQQCNIQPTATAKAESGGGQLALGREEEDKSACLAGITSWDIEVEDRGYC